MKTMTSRRASLKAMVSAALLALLPSRMSANSPFKRRRPTDRNWPSPSAWQQLNRAVGGNLIPVPFPLDALRNDSTGTAAERLATHITNPYYIRDQPGLTQSLGWVDAWQCHPSVYAIAGRNAGHIAAALNLLVPMICIWSSKAAVTAIRARPTRLIPY